MQRLIEIVKGWLRTLKPIVRTPPILQMEAVECGAAALAIILAYYRRFVPLEELRIACGVSRDGSKASNMLKAARAYALNAKGFTSDLNKVESFPAPYIVFWGFNHFVVVEGFRGRHIYLNDPANGRRKVTRKEFDESFTGVVLTFERSPGFVASGRPPSATRALIARLPGARLGVAFITLASLAAVIPGMVTPAYTRIFFDEILIRGQKDWLPPLIWVMAATGAVSALLTYLNQRTLLRLQGKLSLRGSGNFFRHVMRLPILFFQQRHAGDIATRIGLNNHVASLLSGELAATATSLLMVVFFVPLLFDYDFVLTLAAMFFAVANLVLMKFVSKRMAAGSMSTLTERNKLAGISMSGLQAIEGIKASGGEYDFFTNWAGHYAKLFNRSQQLDKISLHLGSAAGFFLALNGIAMLYLGSRRVMEGALTIGMLIGFQSLMGNFLGPFHNVVGLWARVQSARADLNQLDDVLKNQPKPERAGKSSLTEIWGALELRNLTFGYNHLEPPLIIDLSIRLNPGERVALVGASGSGKSTVAKVVCGLYEPWAGEILIDGKVKDNFDPRALANSLALVDQDILLFEGTIRKNLTLWDPTIEDRAMVAAAKDAAIHDDITERYGGYDQLVEESGRNFSGGQKQRLEIARALALNPKILVLDEATSALDPITERFVDDTLRRRGVTCLIIAHRLSTIRDCDEIVVLDRGRVVERGTHDEMLESGGPYARLIAAS